MARQVISLRLNQFSEDTRDIRADYERRRWLSENDTIDPDDVDFEEEDDDAEFNDGSDLDDDEN